jgi:hypothetical protein
MPPKTKKKQETLEVITAEFLVTREFHSSIAFSEHIESVAGSRAITHMEALMEYCEDRDIEPVAVAPFITESLRTKIEKESRLLHLLIDDRT